MGDGGEDKGAEVMTVMRQAKLVKVEFADPSMAVVVCLSVSCCAVWCASECRERLTERIKNCFFLLVTS